MKVVYLLILCVVTGSFCLNFLDYRSMPIENLEVNEPTNKTHLEGVRPGLGYSSEKESLVSVICFAVSNQQINGDHSEIDFAKAQSYEALNRSLKLDIELQGGYGYFTGSLSAVYSEAVINSSTQMSFNFYAKSTHKVNFNYLYGPDNVLTAHGKSAYKKALSDFINICGDKLITQYERGTALVMSIIIDFNSTQEKRDFEANIRGKVIGLFELSSQIRVAFKNTNVNGNIKIKAIQFGGDPSQLSKLIDDKVKHCNLLQFDECIKVANTIIEYASGDYAKQITDRSTYIPIGQFTTLSISKKGILYNNPISDELINARNWMVKHFKKVSYYNEKLTQFISLYPGYSRPEFKELKSFADSVSSIFEFMSGSNGGRVCWSSELNDCIEAKKEIKNEMTDVFKKEKIIITLLESIRYTETINFGLLEGTDTCRISSKWMSYQPEKIQVFPTPLGQWIFTLNDEKIEGSRVDNNTIQLNINKDKFSFLAKQLTIKFSEEQTLIQGSVTCQEGTINHEVSVNGRKLTADYYFELYDD